MPISLIFSSRTCKTKALRLEITCGFLHTFKNTGFNNITDLKSGYLKNHLLPSSEYYLFRERIHDELQ